VFSIPSETFFHLPQEKRNAIIIAATDEFSRVAYREASINKITEAAGISRGSFYQYFSDKKDILFFVFKEYSFSILYGVQKALRETGGDVFSVSVAFFDETALHLQSTESRGLFRNVFMSMHSADIHPHDDINMWELLSNSKKKQIEDFLSLVDRSRLLKQSDEDLEDLIFLLGAITKRAISKVLFSEVDTESARKTLMDTLQMVRQGFLQNGGE